MPVLNLLAKVLGRVRFQPPPITEAIASWLLSLFLALGPIYWLPGISTELLLRPFEWSILLVALVLVFGTDLVKGRLPFPTGLLGPLGFAGLLLFWMPGLVQAATGFLVLEFVINLGITAAGFWGFFCIARRGGDVFAIFRRAFSILVLLTGATLVVALLGTVDWWAPCEWDSAYVNGLGRSPTGWSLGLAMFVPVASLFLLPGESRRPLLSSLSSFSRKREPDTAEKRSPDFVAMTARLWTGMTAAALGVIVLVASQLVSGGRSGTLVSALVIGGFALLRSTRWLAVSVVLAGLLAGLVYTDESCASHLRVFLLSRVVESVYAPGDADSAEPERDPTLSSAAADFTSHRIQGYALGISKIKDQPLLGHGLFQVVLETRWGARTEIHNLWIKWGAYTGVAAPLLLAVIMALILRTWWRIFWDKLRPAAERSGAVALGLVVLGGLVLSMLEINIPMGAFQTAAVFWAAAGALAGIASRSPQPAVYPPPPPDSGQETAQ